MLESIRNFFKQEKDKGIKDRVLGDIRNLYRLEKNKDSDIKDIVLGDIKNLFRSEKKI